MQVTPGRLLIDGHAREALSGERIETTNPATGEVLTTLARARREDVDLAVAAAKRAFEGSWARTTPIERARILWKAGDLIAARTEELARLETLDVGKLLVNSRTIDVPRTAETFWYFSGWATKLHGETIPVRGPFLNYTLREPLGVVGAIIPWNFPLLMAARKIAPALAAGNTVVLKPAEQASLSALALVQLLWEAGVPEGAVNLVTGLGEEAGAALVEHPDVAKISFTGGTATGRAIMRSAAQTLKKLSLELGGKSPNIIFADANVDAAAASAVSAVFYNQGELCTAGSRLLVEESIREQVTERLVRGAQSLTLGDPSEPSTKLGPLITAEHKASVSRYIDAGDREGAQRLTGGPVEGKGYFVAPTVFARASQEMTIAKEEIFGPVVTILPFSSVEEAARLADATEFGLAAGVWTRDVGKAHSLAAKLKAGTVWINTYNNFDAPSPYGGYKQSGFGRENGRHVLEELTQLKSVWVNLF